MSREFTPTPPPVNWVGAVNNSASPVPAYGLVESAGVDGAGRLKVQAPGQDGLTNLWVNGPVPLPAHGGLGAVHNTFPAAVLWSNRYDEKVPQPGETWGVRAGSFDLSKGVLGFRVVAGSDQNNLVNVVPWTQRYTQKARLTRQGSGGLTDHFGWSSVEAPGWFGYWDQATAAVLWAGDPAGLVTDCDAAATAGAAAAKAIMASGTLADTAAAAAAPVGEAAYTDPGGTSITAAAAAWATQYATTGAGDANIVAATAAGKAAYLASLQAGGGNTVLLFQLSQSGAFYFLQPGYAFTNAIDGGATFTLPRPDFSDPILNGYANTGQPFNWGWGGGLTALNDWGVQVTYIFPNGPFVYGLPYDAKYVYAGGGGRVMNCGDLYAGVQDVGGTKWGQQWGLIDGGNMGAAHQGAHPTGVLGTEPTSEAYLRLEGAQGDNVSVGASRRSYRARLVFPNALTTPGLTSLPGMWFGLSPALGTGAAATEFGGGAAALTAAGMPPFAGLYADENCTFGGKGIDPAGIVAGGPYYFDGQTGVGTAGDRFIDGLWIGPGAGGLMPLDKGGTGADLSGSGAPHAVVQQPTLGGPFISAPLETDDVPGAVTALLATPFGGKL
jgi:hypothetical protein